jgi:hypothetical protein
MVHSAVSSLYSDSNEVLERSISLHCLLHEVYLIKRLAVP